MLTVEVRFLTGRYAATSQASRDRAEWPPEPARLYSALVESWAEAGEDALERRALEWLENQSAPALAAGECAERTVVTTFVPVNDATVLGDYTKLYEQTVAAQDDVREAQLAVAANQPRAAAMLARAERSQAKADTDARARVSKGQAEGLRVLPGERTRQPRTFPSVCPEQDAVWFCWEDADPISDVLAALDAVAARVVRLGHSSSFVACTFGPGAPPVELDWLPDRRGKQSLRGVGNGQLELLEAEHIRSAGVEPRVLPSVPLRYRRATEAAVEVDALPRALVSGDWFVFEHVGGTRLTATRAVAVATAMRNCLMIHADQPPAEVLSGHRADGRPSGRAHAAYLALPFVGHRHATGELIGAAVLLPYEVEPLERSAVLRAIGRWEQSSDDAETVRLTLGRAGSMDLVRVVGEAARRNLRPITWAAPAKRWTTVTPIALDRHPGDLSARNEGRAARAEREALDAVALACLHAGLPAPESVELLVGSPFAGIAPASRFPAFRSHAGGVARALVHARIRFAAAVHGPVVLGAGRFIGLGLCRPEGGE